jgi:hypothetical protein
MHLVGFSSSSQSPFAGSIFPRQRRPPSVGDVFAEQTSTRCAEYEVAEYYSESNERNQQMGYDISVISVDLTH